MILSKCNLLVRLLKFKFQLLCVVALVCELGCTSDYQKVAVLPVAKVNNHTLDVKEFSVLFARSLKELDAIAAKDPNNIKRFKEKILNDFIESSLMIDWANANNIHVNTSDLEKSVKTIRSSYPDDLSFRRFLAESNLSFSEWKDSLQNRLLFQLVFQKLNKDIIAPTDDEIKIYYKENSKHFKRKRRIFLSQIVVPEEPTAEEILKNLKGKDFSEMAKKYSVFPEAKNGGEIGWIEKGNLDFFDGLFEHPIGLVNKIIKSPFGFHLIKILKKEGEGERPLEEVHDEIIRSLLARKEQALYIKWLDVQLRNSKVYKNNELLNSINPITKGVNE